MGEDKCFEDVIVGDDADIILQYADSICKQERYFEGEYYELSQYYKV